MKTIKLLVLKTVEEPLQRLIKCKLPITLSVKLARAMKVLANEYDVLESQRNELVVKYGKQEEDTNKTVVSPENLNDFIKDWTEVLNQEIDLDIENIVIDTEQLKDVEISTEDVIALEQLFEVK